MRQAPPLQQPSDMRWLVFVAVLGVSAGTGYWWGDVHHDESAGAEQGVVAGRRERNDVAKTPNPTPVELVRAARKGTLDERQQWVNVRGFSEDEVKAAIAELKKPELAMFSSSALPAMLF